MRTIRGREGANYKWRLKVWLQVWLKVWPKMAEETRQGRARDAQGRRNPHQSATDARPTRDSKVERKAAAKRGPAAAARRR